MAFGARDLEQMEAKTLARGVDNLAKGTREAAFGRVQMTEAKYREMGEFQRASLADVYGARSMGRVALSARAFDQLTPMQRTAVWNDLGAYGRSAALQYSGLARADVEQMNRRPATGGASPHL
jgi:hypothetical protein